MSFLPLIIQLVTGAIGGNVGGALFKNLSLGTAGNSVAGVAGGYLLPFILSMAGLGGLAPTGTGNLDITSVIQNILGGGVGGTALMAIIGAIKNASAAK